MGILAREVSQISVFAFPCCMGIVFFFDPHAAWERQKQLLRHLPNEKAIFFIFSTPPQREAQKWYECRFRTIVSVHLGNDAKSKSSLKSAAVPVIFFFDENCVKQKSYKCIQESFIFPMNINKSHKTMYSNLFKFFKEIMRFRLPTIGFNTFSLFTIFIDFHMLS